MHFTYKLKNRKLDGGCSAAATYLVFELHITDEYSKKADDDCHYNNSTPVFVPCIHIVFDVVLEFLFKECSIILKFMMCIVEFCKQVLEILAKIHPEWGKKHFVLKHGFGKALINGRKWSKIFKNGQKTVKH